MKWGAVIAAGGTVGPDLAEVIGSQSKALARFAGITSLERTLKALAEAGLDEVVTVGPEALVPHVTHGEWILESGSSLDNVLLGVDRLRADAVLMLPADTPLFTGESLMQFLQVIESRTAAGPWFAAAASELSVFRAQFPEAPVQAVRLREGRMVVSGMYAATPDALSGAVARLKPLIGARKSQLGVVARIGPAPLIKFLLGRLTARDVEMTAEKILGSPGILVADAHPATCLDVDTIEDYHAVQAIVARTELPTVRVEST